MKSNTNYLFGLFLTKKEKYIFNLTYLSKNAEIPTKERTLQNTQLQFHKDHPYPLMTAQNQTIWFSLWRAPCNSVFWLAILLGHSLTTYFDKTRYVGGTGNVNDIRRKYKKLSYSTSEKVQKIVRFNPLFFSRNHRLTAVVPILRIQKWMLQCPHLCIINNGPNSFMKLKTCKRSEFCLYCAVYCLTYNSAKTLGATEQKQIFWA